MTAGNGTRRSARRTTGNIASYANTVSSYKKLQSDKKKSYQSRYRYVKKVICLNYYFVCSIILLIVTIINMIGSELVFMLQDI